MTEQIREAVVLFAHGSRDPEWAAPFRAIARKLSEQRTHVRVELAFLELMQPRLADTLDGLAAAGFGRVTIAPLFMAQGAHLKRDLGALIEDARTRHPDVAIVELPAVGESEQVVDAISGWVAANC